MCDNSTGRRPIGMRCCPPRERGRRKGGHGNGDCEHAWIGALDVGALGWVASGVDDRAIGDDAVVFVPELQSAEPGQCQLGGAVQLRVFLHRPGLFQSIRNTLLIVGGVLFITVIGGTAIALLLDQPMWGQGIVRS
ncbi:hypothetical protein DdX_22315 [Ditylenchus destructor]|uniref:Uncharacterized protein n=1 Tax=Ditylenchus destructor TaxID=166010 RepID=A0AAD4QUJ9_9BILA|nr:hypothetical protein DdX_22315 [Ditylenchus destructor]